MVSYRRHSSETLLVATVILCCWFCAPTAAEDGPRLQLTDLKAKDQVIEKGLTLALEMRVPAHPFDPDQGTVSQTCTLTYDGQSCAIVAVNEYEQKPVFRPVGFRDYRPFDYDGDGNLILWRDMERFALFAADRNDAYVEQQMLRISPAGDVLETVRHVQLQCYPLGSKDNIYDFDQVLMAVGRGFSSKLQRITESHPVKRNLLEVQAFGSYGPSQPGVWSLRVEPGADHLVRDASFAPEGTSEPTITVASIGRIEAGGLVIGRSGVITYGGADAGYTISVAVLGLTPKADASTLEKARNQVQGPLPPGEAEIVDFRTDPVQRTPIGREE